MAEKENMDMQRALDLAEQLDCELGHISYMLELLRIGIENDRYNDKGNEISAIHILQRYIKHLKNVECAGLMEVLSYLYKG